MAIVGRLARMCVAVLLTIVVVAGLLVGGAATLLRTSWGADRVRRFVLPRVNAANMHTSAMPATMSQ